MRTIAPVLAFLFVVVSATAASAQNVREAFRYEVSWGDAQVATMKLDVGCQKSSHVPAALVAKSTGVANQIHSFDIRLDSFFSPDGRSLEGRTRIVEEGQPRRFKSRFKTATDVRVTKEFNGKTSQRAFKLPGASHDLLSWMLNLRYQDLKAKKPHTYWVWDGWKLSKIEAFPRGTESVATSKGAHRATRIALYRTVMHHGGPHAFRPREDREELGTLWIGTDKARTPWAMTFDAPIGEAKITLQSVTRKRCAQP